jgi:multidrug efflux pump subunit AcrA (membrane-fusion protein)
MFGRLLLPCGTKTALLIPASAVQHTGQLELVRVLEGGEAQLRHVRTGKVYGDRIEVLSGLREGERILSEGK